MSCTQRTYYLVLVTVLLSWIVVVCSSNLSNTECPPWFFYNTTTNQCQCYHNEHLARDIHCTEDGIYLGLGNCMTYESSEGTFFAKCFYFQLPHGSVLASGYFFLPKNVSELNDFMCGPMYRKGRVCSECIDGFGPSLTSTGYKCTKCSNPWRGLLLYVLVEFGPTTVFYFLVLTFRIGMTSSPMTCFILYSQLMVYTIFKDPVILNKMAVQTQNGAVKYVMIIAGTFYGIWNLDFLKFIVPPICISTKLSIIHIEFLSLLSALYSLLLIILTWICVELRDRNYKPFVLLWKPFHRCFVRVRYGYHTKKDIIDVFATFLLLIYSKLIYQSVQILGNQYIMRNGLHYRNVNLYDPTIAYMSSQHLPYVVVSLIIIVVFVIPPPFILLLYPTRAFGAFLTLCKVNGRLRVALLTFVEKYYGCYKDKLDGGHDMRYFSALYFFIRPMIIIIYIIRTFRLTYHIWFFAIILFGGVAMLIALVKPYKKSSMNLVDSLLLALIAVLCLLAATPFENSLLNAFSEMILFLAPMLIFLLIMILNLIFKLKRFNFCRRYQHCISGTQTIGAQSNAEVAREYEEIQCLLPPTLITVNNLSYNSI